MSGRSLAQSAQERIQKEFDEQSFSPRATVDNEFARAQLQDEVLPGLSS